MDEGWRVKVSVYDQPGTRRKSLNRSVDDLRRQLGGHIRVNYREASIFLYATTATAATGAEHVARQVLAQGNVAADFCLEHWDPLEEEWRDTAAGLNLFHPPASGSEYVGSHEKDGKGSPSDAATEPTDAAEPADGEDEERAVHELLQEQERQRSVATGLAAWQVRVDLSSHRRVVDLAERLTSEGWPLVRRRRFLVAGANCQDDADALAQEIQGYVGADAAVRVEKAIFNWGPAPDASPGF
jgi:hypothetical protein